MGHTRKRENAAIQAAAREDASAAFDLSTFTAGLELPTAIEFLPDGRLVIAEKMGRVLVRLATGERWPGGGLCKVRHAFFADS